MPRVPHARIFGAALTPTAARDSSGLHAGLKIERPLRGLENRRIPVPLIIKDLFLKRYHLAAGVNSMRFCSSGLFRCSARFSAHSSFRISSRMYSLIVLNLFLWSRFNVSSYRSCGIDIATTFRPRCLFISHSHLTKTVPLSHLSTNFKWDRLNYSIQWC